MGNPFYAETPPPSPTARRRKFWYLMLTGVLGAVFLGWFLFVKSPEVRIISAHLFGQMGVYSVVHHLAHDENAAVQVAAKDLLVEAGADAVPTVLDGLSHSLTERRLVNLSILSRIGNPAASATPKLTEMASRDNNAGVRASAISILPRIAKEDPTAIQAMVDALNDSVPKVRIAAAGALGDLGAASRDAIPALAKNLDEDQDAQARHAITEALAKIGPDERSVRALAKALREDADPEVRAEACESLGAFGPRAKNAVAALAQGLRDEYVRARQEAAAALGNIGPDARAAIPSLREALRDPVESVANEAKNALSRIGE